MKLNEERAKIARKKSMLIDLYTDKAIPKDQFLHKMEEYSERERQIALKIAEVETKLKQVINRPKIMEHAEHFCNIMKERIHNLTNEQKRQILRYIVEKIILDPNKGEAKVIGHVPIESGKEAFLQPQVGTLSTISWNYEKYPNSWLKFELKVRI